MRFLVVCTGNLCRSPMGEVVLRALLEERGADAHVASAGTWAVTGSSATTEAVDSVLARGLDLSGHQARDVDPDELAQADLVLVMTSVHLRELTQVDPDVRRKTFLIKELGEVDQGAIIGSSPAERLASLKATARPAGRRALDLDDPYGLPRASYERALRELDEGLRALVDMVFPLQTPRGAGAPP